LNGIILKTSLEKINIVVIILKMPGTMEDGTVGDFNTTIKNARENYINELESEEYFEQLVPNENERRHQRRLRRSERRVEPRDRNGYRGGTKTKRKTN
jgi:hypothetical protein